MYIDKVETDIQTLYQPVFNTHTTTTYKRLEKQLKHKEKQINQLVFKTPKTQANHPKHLAE